MGTVPLLGGIAMRCLVATGMIVLAASGCASWNDSWNDSTYLPGRSVQPCYENPTLIPAADHQVVWETVVDVVDDYFDVAREESVRRIGNTLFEGRIETRPEVASTILEPWRNDSVGRDQQIESTLQSMRRSAVVRIEPAEGGFLVEVIVLKELEELARPEHATAGAATFRYDASLTRVVNPVGGEEVPTGWIPQGRDTLLEQRILGQIHAYLGQSPVQLLPPVR